MTLIVECDSWFQWKPFVWRRKGVMLRFGWLWFSLAFSPKRIDQLMLDYGWDVVTLPAEKAGDSK